LGAPLKGANYASIDIGSHTIRLLIAGLEGLQVRPLYQERQITRLARNFQDGETLKNPEMQRSIDVLKGYASTLSRFEVASVVGGATGVIRRARNQASFLEAIERSAGLQVSIVSEESEARLSAKGILSALPSPEGFTLSFDLGGSSTEFLLTSSQQTKPLYSTSLFIGASTVTERLLSGDPPDKSAIREARESLSESLAPALSDIRSILENLGLSPAQVQLVGTAGTVTTLAAMQLEMTVYEPFRVNGLELTQEWLEETIDRLSRLPVSSRRGIPGLEDGREDIILGGALIVSEILNGLALTRLIVTDAGLLEGLLLDLIEREHGLPDRLATPLKWQLKKE
jgi:exopolyphosphatase / guanosine-5'-triphosphate,3'-diphosphate pyrophosphatase